MQALSAAADQWLPDRTCLDLHGHVHEGLVIWLAAVACERDHSSAHSLHSSFPSHKRVVLSEICVIFLTELGANDMSKTSLADRIMARVRGYGRGKKVYTWKDFEDLGRRPAVDQALSRLAKGNSLRRVARGFYDLPRESKLLGGSAPASTTEILNALERRDEIVVRPDNVAAANILGLTTIVPVQNRFRSTGGRRNIKLDNSVIELRPAGAKLANWIKTPAATVIQALIYVGRSTAKREDIAPAIKKRLPKEAKEALRTTKGSRPLWMHSLIEQMADFEDKTRMSQPSL